MFTAQRRAEEKREVNENMPPDDSPTMGECPPQLSRWELPHPDYKADEAISFLDSELDRVPAG